MSHSLKMILAATAFAAAATVASASTHHPSKNASHARYSEACSTLAGQWSSAEADHKNSHKFRKAERQESIGARDCASRHTATLKVGAQHYRTALRMLGVKPQA